jgi:hypothetical protein
VIAVQQRAAGRLGGIDPAGQHQAVRLLGQQLVPARVAGVHQGDRPLQQPNGADRRARRRVAGGPPQPVDRLGISAGRSASEMLSHLQGCGGIWPSRATAWPVAHLAGHFSCGLGLVITGLRAQLP